MNNTIGLILISIGIVFDLIGCLGLVRLPDVYTRLQASTKCVVSGTSLILFGTFLMVGFTAAGIKILLCMIFLILIAPVTAHALSRGAHRAGFSLGKDSVVDQYAEDKERK
jgi:multicomponent Na+:H+ antiporter subunit G